MVHPFVSFDVKVACAYRKNCNLIYPEGAIYDILEVSE